METAFDVAPPPQDDGLSQLASQAWPSQHWVRNRVRNVGDEHNGYSQYHDHDDYLQTQEPQTQTNEIYQSQYHQTQPYHSIDYPAQSQRDSFYHDHQQLPEQHVMPPQQRMLPAQSILNDQSNYAGMLVPVSEIPDPYRSLFTQFPYFNIVQSTVFKDVFYSERSVVVSAPTGSGKTVVMELAIVSLLLSRKNDDTPAITRIVYMAPIKALVTERYMDWRKRLSPLGMTCAEVTGDTDHDGIDIIRNSHVILTTPEKWDSLTRRWKDHANVMQAVSLLLIDEVHVLNDESRGPTLEAVVSRMKTIRATKPIDNTNDPLASTPIRFVAVSATVPNAEDVATWLSDDHGPAISHKLDESLRPVKLRRIVMGYDCRDSWSEFRFDIHLNYRLPSIIATYSDGKPSLVFVSTRKGTQTTAMTMARESRLVRDAGHKQLLNAVANGLRDNKLREVVMCGVGYHHAGLEMCDRRQVEELFVAGQLPVLVATSTLAMGVNLPAHLVVIKSTAQYVGGGYEEYSTAQLLQMTGRAGRPQFDTHATSVIMTKMQHKNKYQNLVNGRSLLESHLHLHLVEHLNAEVVLGTVTDLAVAVEWLRSTFFYVRVQRNPKQYGLPLHLQPSQLEAKLQEMCTREVNALAKEGLITMDEVDMKSTIPGRLMARYCISFNTMKTFLHLRGDESLRELLEIVSDSQEFWDVKVRMSEKKVLNDLNKSNSSSVRFPIKGRIKTRANKVNCLVQATFCNQNVVDPGLTQEVGKIMRTGQRITKCLAEYGATRNEYELHLNTQLLAKCFYSRLWENSRFVTRQLERIGPTFSSNFVAAKITSFTALEQTTARDIELILNRQPPFGNRIREQALKLPRYELTIQQISQVSRERSEVRVTVRLANLDQLREGTTTPKHHSCRLIIGDVDNKVVFHIRVTDATLMVSGSLTRTVMVTRAQNGDELAVNFISETWAGLDVQSSYTPRYTPRLPKPGSRINTDTPNTANSRLKQTQIQGVGIGIGGEQQRRACLHACSDKRKCAHNCCKVGVSEKSDVNNRDVPTLVQEVRKRASQMPPTAVKKMKTQACTTGAINLSKFKFVPSRPTMMPPPTMKNLPNKLFTPSNNQQQQRNPQQQQQRNPQQHNQLEDDLDIEILDEFNNDMNTTVSNDEFPDMSFFVDEVEKENNPDYEDCFNETLDIDGHQNSQQNSNQKNGRLGQQNFLKQQNLNAQQRNRQIGQSQRSQQNFSTQQKSRVGQQNHNPKQQSITAYIINSQQNRPSGQPLNTQNRTTNNSNPQQNNRQQQNQYQKIQEQNQNQKTQQNSNINSQLNNRQQQNQYKKTQEKNQYKKTQQNSNLNPQLNNRQQKNQYQKMPPNSSAGNPQQNNVNSLGQQNMPLQGTLKPNTQPLSKMVQPAKFSTLSKFQNTQNKNPKSSTRTQNSTGFQNSTLENSTGFQISTDQNSTGFQNSTLASSTGFQISTDQNSTGFQNSTWPQNFNMPIPNLTRASMLKPAQAQNQGNIRPQNQGQNQMPQGQNQMPQGQNQMPQGQNQMPQVQNQIPQGQNQMSQGFQGQNQMPQGQNQMPQVSYGQNQTPQRQNRLSKIINGGQNQVPQGQNQIPQRQTPQRQNKLSQVIHDGQNQTPRRQNHLSQIINSGQNQMPQIGQNQTPQRQNRLSHIINSGQNQMPQPGQNQTPQRQNRLSQIVNIGQNQVPQNQTPQRQNRLSQIVNIGQNQVPQNQTPQRQNRLSQIVNIGQNLTPQRQNQLSQIIQSGQNQNTQRFLLGSQIRMSQPQNRAQILPTQGNTDELSQNPSQEIIPPGQPLQNQVNSQRAPYDPNYASYPDVSQGQPLLSQSPAPHGVLRQLQPGMLQEVQSNGMPRPQLDFSQVQNQMVTPKRSQGLQRFIRQPPPESPMRVPGYTTQFPAKTVAQNQALISSQEQWNDMGGHPGQPNYPHSQSGQPNNFPNPVILPHGNNYGQYSQQETASEVEQTFGRGAYQPIFPSQGNQYQKQVSRVDPLSTPPQQSQIDYATDNENTRPYPSNFISGSQVNKPLAGVKPILSKLTDKISSKLEKTGDPNSVFSHLTKEWSDAKKSKSRDRTINVLATPQRRPQKRFLESPAPKSTPNLGDEWRDLEIFQLTRQKERNTLDSLYQVQSQQPQGQTEPKGVTGGGSLHITYGRGSRGPLVGVDLHGVGGLQQNININLSNHLESTHNDTHPSSLSQEPLLPPPLSQQNVVEPQQVRGILKKSQSHWNTRDIFEGIL